MTTLAFASRRPVWRWTSALRRSAATAVPMLPVFLARAALAAGVWLLAGPGWALLVAGLLMAVWPKRAAR